MERGRYNPHGSMAGPTAKPQQMTRSCGCCYSMPPPCPPPACAPPPPPPLPCPPPPIFAADSLEEEMEATCNNKKLRVIIEDNMTTDPTISKRAIQKAAEEKLRGKFNVICAKGDFTYIAYTDTFCQASNEDVTCYAFKPMYLSQLIVMDRLTIFDLLQLHSQHSIDKTKVKHASQNLL
ncbi:ground-like domain protein [Teladorsagia circumcincta]|uniref:Ground-like domain protein n=1 Tax=Teladorsagia circumcincta TaxID=45464 RepID=A0A2G9U0L5_TELCI|nr:ground-like domain protein [Teladorsagia circumcincta]